MAAENQTQIITNFLSFGHSIIKPVSCLNIHLQPGVAEDLQWISDLFFA